MSDDRKVLVVCYDIADPIRLRRVYKVCRAWGDHLQFSVFRCTLSARQLAEFKAELTPILDHEKDQVMFVVLGGETSGTWGLTTLGQPLMHAERVARVI